ncbi:hypothetical protein N0V82_000305 [Gnomoniopsis sp. IMI 355080]|nr:hypothetical protein N0V82_000305 [Gnomoniopsis sp. IMI 355080]
MTSTASQPASTPAPNNTAASTAPSYASAAGATKKPASTPLVVTGANPPSVAGSSAASASTQNAPSPVNGRQPVPPAVPTIANGTSSLNGDPADHSRNGSVSITAPGNGYTNKAAAPGIQFGFDKTPQPSSAVPIPAGVGNAQRVPSPALSPAPIPQPSASGGKPGATDSQFKIGSFPNDGDRMANMRPNSMSMSFHNRRDSNVSHHSDMGHHGGPPGPSRGGFNHAAGRGGGRGMNAPQYNPQAGGFPPGNYNRGPHPYTQGRGMVPGQPGYRGSMPSYSPQPTRGSPAMPHAMPGQGTPNMPSAMPVPPPQQGYNHQYAPPISAGGYPPQVNHPFPRHHETPLLFNQKQQYKKKGGLRTSENRLSHLRQPTSPVQSFSSENNVMPQRLSKRRDSTSDHDKSRFRGPILEFQRPRSQHPLPLLNNRPELDLSPGPEGFGRVERMLIESKQNYQFPGYDPRNPSYMGVPNYGPQPPMFSGSPNPGYYGVPFPPPAPQAQSMSRGNSQISERPASSTGVQGPVSAAGPPPTPKGSTVGQPTGSNFIRPKRVTVSLKTPAGESLDFRAIKTPASPVPSVQQSKTPPVIASTPTPPPKPQTPTSHSRTESSAKKPPENVKAEFAALVNARLTEADGSKAEDSTEAKTEDKIAADEKVKEDERKQDEERAQAEQKAAEAKAAEAKAAEAKAAEAKAAEAKAAEAKAAEAKAAAEAESKAKAEADEKAKADEKVKADEKAKAEAESKVDEAKSDNAAVTGGGQRPGESDDDYIDRQIREMEEEDARREAEQAEITKRKQAEKEAAKKAAEGGKLSAEENDRKLREQEREMERIEEEKEKARKLAEQGGESKSVAELLAGKISDITSSQKKETSDGANAAADKLSKLTINSSLHATSPGSAPSSAKSTGKDRRPAALNLAPLKTGSVEAPPPTAAMQALKSSRFLTIKDEIKYPVGIASPNPAINATAAKKGGSFKYDSAFLLQFQKVFTEQPSAEFSQQVKSLIGDSDGARSASTRGSRLDPRSNSKSASGGGAFGSFTQPAGGKALPPGTTSDQRFAMSQGQMARPAMSGPMASFGRGGGFPSGSPMGRTPSGMGLSNSRQGSRTQPRGNSKQGKGYDGQAEKLAKTMPLTAGMDLKPIQVSATGWKPMSLTRNAQQPTPGSDLLDPATVQRKVKAALNKMTPENFDKISGQILQIAAQSKDEQDGRTLRQVIQLTFEKATDEAHWAAMYAKFCQCMLENMSPEVKDITITDKAGNVVSGGALFRKYLLNRCQEDFERGWNTDMPEPKEGESKEAALMSDEYYKAMAIKRRGLGLVQFIGELFRLGMLTERIMHECVRKLLDFKGDPDEAEIESLTKLLRTIGADLDRTEKGVAMMNAYFERISSLVESTTLPSRLQFMLMDIMDLRKAKWVSKDGLKGPKTREEIRADAEAALAAKAAEASRSSNRGHQGSGRFNSGRGDARGYGGFQPNPASNTVGMDDLRRLKGSASRAASGNVTLGPTSMFNSRSNSGRRMGPGGSLTRGAEDSGGSSRTGTPGPQASVNAFAALANMGESENPASPPSAAASPALNHAKPDASAN